MTYRELIDSLKEITPLEDQVKEMGLEARREFLEKIMANHVPIEYVDQNNPEIGSLMLHYGIKGENTYGPSPILHSKPAKTYIALGVNAEAQGIGKWLVVQRHSRYIFWFEHSHSFVEINYMLSGECVNIVNGQKLHMQCGDFLIMAPGCRHEIEPLGENDLLINLILLPISAEMILEKTIPGRSEIAQFLIAALYSDSSKSNYVLLNTHGNEKIYNVVCDLLIEYYNQDQIAADVLVECLMHELFARLWRFNEQHPDMLTFAFKPNSKVAMIINFIKENSIACTRESVAKHFSYSPSRLSNILNETIGKGFVQLRNEFRLNIAENKLMSTNLPVRTIAEECGFTNVTHFYKVYKEYFGKLPRNQSPDK